MDDSVDVYYPVWMQLLSLLGLPLLIVTGGWLVTRPVWEEGIGLVQFLAGAIMGAVVLYQCAIGWRAMRYLRVRITASLQGLELFSEGRKRVIPWSKFALPKEYSFAGTTHLFLRNGETVLYAFDNMAGIGIVKSLIQQHHEEAGGR